MSWRRSGPRFATTQSLCSLDRSRRLIQYDPTEVFTNGLGDNTSTLATQRENTLLRQEMNVRLPDWILCWQRLAYNLVPFVENQG